MEKFKKDKTKHDDNSRYKDSKLSIFPLIESIKIYISKSYRNFKADDNRSFTQSYFSDAVKLLLDTYPNAAAAYSLRKLSTSYQGPAIRVRRSSDNQEQDIGFDANGNLNITALTNFVNTDGFVTTWYDQSGNSNNATQSTAASQPQIVSAGNVILKNGKAEIDFTSDFLTIPSSSGTFKYLHDGTNSSIFSVATFGKVADPNEIYCLIGNNGNTSSKTGILIAYDDRTSVVRNNSNFIYVTMGSGGIISDVANNAITPNAQRLLSYFLDADNSTASLRSQTGINGSALVGNNNTSAAPVVTNASHDLQIGASGNNLTLLTGGIQELIFYDYSQSPNRSVIETNINQYYSIY